MAQVTLNRVKSTLYPNTICDVVYQAYQFSWTRENLKVKNKEAWDAAMRLAQDVKAKAVSLPKFTATNFHAKTIKPKWAANKTKVATIGNHVFYR